MKIEKINDYIVVVSDEGKILDIKHVNEFRGIGWGQPIWVDPNLVPGPGTVPLYPYYTWTTTSTDTKDITSDEYNLNVGGENTTHLMSESDTIVHNGLRYGATEEEWKLAEAEIKKRIREFSEK